MPETITSRHDEALAEALRRLDFLEPALDLMRQGQPPRQALLDTFIEWQDANPF